jgi:hypothetical protein
MDVNNYSEFNPNSNSKLKQHSEMLKPMDSNLLFPGYNSSRKEMQHRISIDAGYESLLSTSSFSYLSNTSHSSSQRMSLVPNLDNTMAESSSSTSMMLLDEPQTPVKSPPAIFEEQNSSPASFYPSSNTPDKQVLAAMTSSSSYMVADVDAIYFKSIRISAKKNSPGDQESMPSSISSLSLASFAGASPFKSTMHHAGSHFNHFSASASNSPIKLTQSPKFVRNTPEDYLHERASMCSKLLRSPAFKQCNIAQPTDNVNASTSTPPYRPEVSSFQSRFQFNSPSPVSQQQPLPRTTTEMESEFIDILIRNKHVPANLEFLIGRHVGLDAIDIISELHNRNMHNVLDHVFRHLSPGDLVSVGGVSAQWRSIVSQDLLRVARRRADFIKSKKKTFERFKENRKRSSFCSFSKPGSMNESMATAANLNGLDKRRATLTRSGNMGGYEGNRPNNFINSAETLANVIELACKSQPLSLICQNRLNGCNSFDMSGVSSAASLSRKASLIETASSNSVDLPGMACGVTSRDLLYNQLKSTGPGLIKQALGNLKANPVSIFYFILSWLNFN